MPTIPSGQQSSTFTIATADTYTLDANTTRTQTAGTGIQATAGSGYTTIDIQGRLNDTASGARAIRANVPSGHLIVGSAGLVQSRNGDAVQAQSATGRFDINNFGQIIATNTVVQPTVGGPNPGTADALNFTAVTGAANAPATGLHQRRHHHQRFGCPHGGAHPQRSGDAIRLGSHQTLINDGTINGNGPVNDASSNNSFNQLRTLSGNATARLTLAQTAQPTSTTFATNIANFGAGSQLDLQGLTDAQVNYDSSTSLLTVTGTSGGGSVTQSYALILANGETADGFQTQDDGDGGTLVTVCYASGTGILTAEGNILVESLRVGDLAVTSSGHHRSIKWIGHRTVT